jgi:hypothetical protein
LIVKPYHWRSPAHRGIPCVTGNRIRKEKSRTCPRESMRYGTVPPAYLSPVRGRQKILQQVEIDRNYGGPCATRTHDHRIKSFLVKS